jgi:hypothetical protein
VHRNSAILASIVAAAAVAAIGYYSGHRTGLEEARSAAATATPASKPPAVPIGAARAGANAHAAGGAEHASAPAHKMLDSAASNGSATAPPLPPAGTPLAQIFDELKARADAGDAAAASRLFDDLQHCATAQRLGQFLPAVANRMLSGDLPSGADALARSDRELDRVQRDLEFQQGSVALCAGLTPMQLGTLVPATLAAAQLGDMQAADCYVGANLNAWPDVLNNPDWISNYKNNALPLATAAVQQGDWPMVGMLASANAGNPRSNNMLNQITGTNAVQAYTYARLMSLGQPSDAPPSSRSTNALSTLSSQLTPEQIQQADAQAQQMYQQYFNATPRQTGQVANAMRGCQAGF